jgi:hypothetical protein
VLVVVLVAAASVPVAAAPVPVVVVVVSVVVLVAVLAAVLAASVPVLVAVPAPEVLGVLLVSELPLQAARDATRAMLAPARAKFLRFNIRSIRLLLIPDEFVPLTALSD